MEALWTAMGVFFAIGACVGSFLNVVIYRVPRGLSVSNPKRSFCPRCEAQIAARHNLPILSWVLLSGRCASCSVSIPARYFLVEVITAVLFAVLAWMRLEGLITPGPSDFIAVGIDCLVASLIVAITVIDFQLALIPDPLTVPWLPVLVLAVGYEPDLLRGRLLLADAGVGTSSIVAVLAGVAVGSFPALLIDFLRRERDVVASGEDPESALPPDDEEFSLAQETRWMLPRILGPAAIGGMVAYVLFAGRVFESAGGRAAIVSAAGVGAGLVLIYAIRFVFSALFGKEAMGLGDAKFLALAGGLLGPEGTAGVFFLGAMLGSLPALVSLARKLPGTTGILIGSAVLPIVLLDAVSRALGPTASLAVVMPIPLVGLVFFLRRLRRSSVPMTAMPFGPFLAIAALVLMFAPPYWWRLLGT